MEGIKWVPKSSGAMLEPEPEPEPDFEITDEELALLDCGDPSLDTVRGPLDGIGMGASCPTRDEVLTPKDRRRLFRHLDGDTGGSRREGQNYQYVPNSNRGVAKVKIRGYRNFAQA
jgi:hypothetical protein